MDGLDHDLSEPRVRDAGAGGTDLRTATKVRCTISGWLGFQAPLPPCLIHLFLVSSSYTL
jgi:hypothetical protein